MTSLFISGIPASVERDLEAFITNEVEELRDLFYEQGGFVAVFNEVEGLDNQEEIDALRDLLGKKFASYDVAVRLYNSNYEGGEGVDFPAYDTAGYGYEGATRTIEIQGIPPRFCNDRSAKDIASQVFIQYGPMDCFVQDGRLFITFKGPLTQDDVYNMGEDLQEALLEKNKRWGPEVRVVMSRDETGAARRMGGFGTAPGLRPPQGKPRRNASSGGNWMWIMMALFTVLALLLLLAFIFFGPRTFCQKVEGHALASLMLGSIPGVCDWDADYVNGSDDDADPKKVACDATKGKLHSMLGHCENEKAKLHEIAPKLTTDVEECSQNWDKCQRDKRKLKAQLAKLGIPPNAQRPTPPRTNRTQTPGTPGAHGQGPKPPLIPGQAQAPKPVTRAFAVTLGEDVCLNAHQRLVPCAGP